MRPRCRLAQHRLCADLNNWMPYEPVRAEGTGPALLKSLLDPARQTLLSVTVAVSDHSVRAPDRRALAEDNPSLAADTRPERASH